MKVLTFVTGLDKTKGGPSRSIPVFVKGLAEIGVDITLMAIESENMNLHALDGTSAKTHVIPSNYKKKELAQFVKQEGFDLIHGQSIWEPLFHQMRIVADSYNIPYMLTPRGTLEPWSLDNRKWKKRIARWLYQDKDLRHCACIYTTADMEAMHVRQLGFSNPICVIPNGIEIDDYPCRTNAEIVQKQLLFLSRIHPKKGIELLLNAWKRIQPLFPDWNLKIVGNGESDYIDSLKCRVLDLGIKDSVEICPPVFGKEKHNLYCLSSLFVLPTYSENFGMVIAEALACGLPVVTTKNTPWELLNETKTGWCIDLSEDILCDTLKEAMSMPKETLYDMGQKGSIMVSENFDYRSVAIKNKQLYEWILKGGTTPSFVQTI